ncbi:MAG: hypothetical protein R3F33_12055 [Planctomycetota bacterium]
MQSPQEPSPDELLAMAYVDGELDHEARRVFESRLAGEAGLARVVAELRDLEVVTRNMIPPEPEDREWRRLWQNPWHSGGWKLAWLLCILSAIGATFTLLPLLWSGEGNWVLRLSFAAGFLGIALLLGLTLRERLAVLPYDPYRKVRR